MGGESFVLAALAFRRLHAADLIESKGRFGPSDNPKTTSSDSNV